MAGQEGLLGESTITEGFLEEEEEESAEAQTSTSSREGSTVMLRAVGRQPQAQDKHRSP